MNKAATKTDNSYLEMKVRLRMDNLPEGSELDVLDCFSGDGLIWREVQRQARDKRLHVLSLDRKPSLGKLHLVGDNRKFLSSMDLRKFDVIDLDAYGTDLGAMKLVLLKPRRPGAVVFGTFIQSVMGCLTYAMLTELGYTRTMVQKIPTLFYRNGRAKLLAWLADNRIKQVKMYSTADGRKNYFSFVLP